MKKLLFKLGPIFCLLLNINIYFRDILADTVASTNEFLTMDGPYFDDISPRNVTAVADDTVVLRCKVKNKGNNTVSWMRKRDLRILTSNVYTYTSDERFSVIHPEGSDDWDLKIEYGQTHDNGIYECQVNTEPKINLAIVLDIIAARAKILGSKEIHVKLDSTISISCAVNIHATSILWYHGESLIDFDSLRGGISLETEKSDIGTTSRLMLTRASMRDSGNYTCAPQGSVPVTVRVHVLTGEQPAAMQTSNGVLSLSHLANITICTLLITAWHYSVISHTTSKRSSFPRRR
ncbi:uncharacterized protein LOC119685013 [Teleopsis dalmanni]|uniref:uncharacterized protein LOC119685013 n=1 Tax=Teleopsis dalmanni TaxID=139649 RepID=UPI0018CC7DB0|nr:uncharacterized protein LOC119685013 [Teleopsis dalmanni]